MVLRRPPHRCQRGYGEPEEDRHDAHGEARGKRRRRRHAQHRVPTGLEEFEFYGDSVGAVIVWINGTHGAGKTTTSALVQQLIPDSRVFDAEKVGETLMDITPGLPETDNFQHWPPWRPLVVETARRVLDYTGGTLVMPMTVLVEQYWREISTGLAQHAIPVRHFVLHADQDTLRGRIEAEHARPVPVPPQVPRALRRGGPHVAARRGRGRRHHAPHARPGRPARIAATLEA